MDTDEHGSRRGIAKGSRTTPFQENFMVHFIVRLVPLHPVGQSIFSASSVLITFAYSPSRFANDMA
jgi:hypothetical protein